MRIRGVSMISAKIALIILFTLLTATAAFSQDVPKEQPTPQAPANASPEPNSSTPKPKSVRVGGNVAAANLIHQVTPVYPKDAKKHHIQGAVVLHAIIAQDGTMKNVEYVSGPPELTDSAIAAVKKWRYKPTLLRGEPIEVDTTISVIFKL
jgi:TonB family protein